MSWLLRRFRQYAWIDWLLTRAESYAALMDEYPGLRTAIRIAVAAMLGAWTAIAESWLPVGVAVAVLVYSALNTESLIRSLHRSGSFTIHYADRDAQYAISRIRLLSMSLLDPAADALEQLYNDRLLQLKIAIPEMTPMLPEYGELASQLLAQPRTQMRHLLKIENDNSSPVSEEEMARGLKAYLEGYVRMTGMVMKDYQKNLRALVDQAGYKEWRLRHKALQKMRDELYNDPRLAKLNVILGCTGLQVV